MEEDLHTPVEHGFDDEESPSVNYPKLWHVWGITGITIITFLIVSAVGILFFTQVSMVLAEVAIILPALVYLKIKGFSAKMAFRIKPITPGMVGLSIIMGLTLSIVASEVDTAVGNFYPMPEDIRQSLEQLLMIHNMGDLILNVSGIVLAAAICEELFFRGFIQTLLEKRQGAIWAIVLSSLVFGIVHFNPWWFVSILFAGVLLGVIAYATGSIYPGIIVHAINNGISLLILNARQIDSLQWLAELETVPWSLFFVSAVILFSILVKLIKHRLANTVHQPLMPDS